MRWRGFLIFVIFRHLIYNALVWTVFIIHKQERSAWVLIESHGLFLGIRIFLDNFDLNSTEFSVSVTLSLGNATFGCFNSFLFAVRVFLMPRRMRLVSLFVLWLLFFNLLLLSFLRCFNLFLFIAGRLWSLCRGFFQLR
jgi:hypothetical protein